MICENCTCPSCAEAASIRQILASIPEDEYDMSAIPEEVYAYWAREDAKDKLAHPGRKTYCTFDNGRLTKQVVVDVFTQDA